MVMAETTTTSTAAAEQKTNRCQRSCASLINLSTTVLPDAYYACYLLFEILLHFTMLQWGVEGRQVC